MSARAGFDTKGPYVVVRFEGQNGYIASSRLDPSELRALCVTWLNACDHADALAEADRIEHDERESRFIGGWPSGMETE